MSDNQNSADSSKSTTSTPKTTPETDPDKLLEDTEPVTPNKNNQLNDLPDVELPGDTNSVTPTKKTT